MLLLSCYFSLLFILPKSLHMSIYRFCTLCLLCNCSGINFILNAMLFNVVPTTLEIGLVCGILVSSHGFPHRAYILQVFESCCEANVKRLKAYMSHWFNWFSACFPRRSVRTEGRERVLMDAFLNGCWLAFIHEPPIKSSPWKKLVCHNMCWRLKLHSEMCRSLSELTKQNLLEVALSL